MRVLLLSILLLFPSLVLGQVGNIYYCSEIQSTGFFPDENYKQKDIELKRFKVLIDFKNKYIKSDEIYFLDVPNYPEFKSCKFGLKSMSNTLMCINLIGNYFSINKNTLRFRLTSLGNREPSTDTIYISHGKCEKF